MKVYIEILVLVGFIFVLILGTIIKLFTGWLAKRRYKPENDKSRLGEERRRDLISKEATLGIGGLAESSQRSNIPPITINPIREDSDSGGKTGKRFRGIFAFRRRR